LEIIWLTKRNFLKVQKITKDLNLQKFKGNPYESLKISDSKVDMKDMAAVFSKDDDDGFTDVLIGPKRVGIRFKKRFFKGGLVKKGRPKIATKGWK
jgi:hypothetical protein